MDTRTGELHDLGMYEKVRDALADDAELERHFVPAPAAKPGQIRATKVGRNGPCPCGSGKKFKACCLGRAASASERRDLAEQIEALRRRRSTPRSTT